MVIAATGASAQSVIAPALIPRAASFFDKLPKEQNVSCEVKPIPARLGFSLRFEAGYVARVPMKQYFGKGHSWLILTRVTPQAGQPVYLGRSIKLPDIPKTKGASESGQARVGRTRPEAGNGTVDSSWSFLPPLVRPRRHCRRCAPHSPAHRTVARRPDFSALHQIPG
jgi:hypothetical protein